ncbi:MAG: proteasome subunit beta [Acidimicrobiia bacterium]|nr:proteasome subunit beta [Acidimicrobiia bacterium]
MSDDPGQPLSLPLGVVSPTSSFTSVLSSQGLLPSWDLGDGTIDAAEATTVLSLRYTEGVVMIGDRQATAGNIVAHRRVQKVYPADSFSAVAISGTAGIAIELTRLFQTELEHYEKLEGSRLSLEGKSNYLARMVRQQLPLAMQGLVVVPIFAGYDTDEGVGRLYSFDVVGGRYEEQDFAATGSGSMEAASHLRANFAEGLDEEGALDLGIRALVAAAEEDTATGGPDLRRGIYPTVVTMTADGFAEIDEERVAGLSAAALEGAR